MNENRWKGTTIRYDEEDRAEHLSPGHLGCQGCGAALGNRIVLKELGQNIVVTIPACCWSVIDGPWPHHAMRVPVYHTAFETAAIMAAGLQAGLEIQGKSAVVVAWAGDGGTADIGFAALSAAAERNENILYICYDNEAYMNTGIQRSGLTPWGAWTSTTPESAYNSRPKKELLTILAAHHIPYAASASLAFPGDLLRKTRKAKEKKGFRFLHMFAPCPPGWKSNNEDTVRLARLAVECRVFPLLEWEDEKWTLNYSPAYRPVSDYLKLQGRFAHLTPEELKIFQEIVDMKWAQWLSYHQQSHRGIEDISTIPPL